MQSISWFQNGLFGNYLRRTSTTFNSISMKISTRIFSYLKTPRNRVCVNHYCNLSVFETVPTGLAVNRIHLEVFLFIGDFLLSHKSFDLILIQFWCAFDNCEIFISKNRFFAKNTFFRFFFFYVKFLIHRSSFLKGGNTVTILIYISFKFFMSSSPQLFGTHFHLKYSTFRFSL